MAINYAIQLTAEIDLDKSRDSLEKYKKEAEAILQSTMNVATAKSVDASSEKIIANTVKNQKTAVEMQEKLNKQKDTYLAKLETAKISDEQRIELQNQLKTALNGSLAIQSEIVQEYQDSLKTEEQKYANELAYQKEKETFQKKQLATQKQINEYIEVATAKINSSTLAEDKKLEMAQKYEAIKEQDLDKQKQAIALLNVEYNALLKEETVRSKIANEQEKLLHSIQLADSANKLNVDSASKLYAEIADATKDISTASTQELHTMSNQLELLKQSLSYEIQRKQALDTEATRRRQIENTIQVYTHELEQAGLKQKELVRLQLLLNTASRDLKSSKNISEMSKVTTELRKWKTELNDAKQNSRSFTTTLQENAKKFTQWLTAGTLVLQTVRMLKSMINEVVELDKALTELAKVTDLSGESMSVFTDRARTAAQEIGRTTSDMVYAAAEWSRAGYDIQEAFQLAELSLIMTNVSDGIDDVSEASSSLISILKGFSLEVSNAAYVLDVLNYTANNFAIDTDNLTTVLEKASGALAMANNEFEELVAMGTAAFSVLRDAESVGSGLVTMAARMRGVSEEGETIVGLTSDMEDAFQKYTNGMVTMIDAQTGELRSTYAVLNDLSEVWDKLTTQEQSYLTELIAGKSLLPSRYRNMLTETNLIAGKVFSNANLKTNILQRKNEIRLSVNVAKAEKNICMI